VRNTPAAACALLGRQVDSTTYIKGDECLDALKDLQQFLHRDDPVGEIDQVRARTAPAPPCEQRWVNLLAIPTLCTPRC
jgi:hypothetical protein